jgi:hypothetical protein
MLLLRAGAAVTAGKLCESNHRTALGALSYNTMQRLLMA